MSGAAIAFGERLRDAERMRIAVSGTHRVGKSSLVEELSSLLPGHALVAEPYVQLAEEGHDFAAFPTVEDFEAQLQRAITDLREARDDVLFDRCPLDLVAYLALHEDGGAFRLGEWLPRIRKVMRTLDLVVFVGVERPDRIAVAAEDRVLREAVDERLRELVLDDAYGLRVPVLAVTGPIDARAAQVAAWQRRPRAHGDPRT